ncbi:hypothetical protein PROFUN_12969 [Planoprotostelium fungivorum]|uniref:Uncharacterized protein n=1 Tax=Planoprotostelium fungivorum TaxID=1890364 RepID=A0A2P6MZJ2_9EUKA|nr:hypothetical protein PROFUN_12969 [Planoprotostelium fungivorum]
MRCREAPAHKHGLYRVKDEENAHSDLSVPQLEDEHTLTHDTAVSNGRVSLWVERIYEKGRKCGVGRGRIEAQFYRPHRDNTNMTTARSTTTSVQREEKMQEGNVGMRVLRRVSSMGRLRMQNNVHKGMSPEFHNGVFVGCREYRDCTQEVDLP